MENNSSSRIKEIKGGHTFSKSIISKGKHQGTEQQRLSLIYIYIYIYICIYREREKEKEKETDGQRKTAERKKMSEKERDDKRKKEPNLTLKTFQSSQAKCNYL